MAQPTEVWVDDDYDSSTPTWGTTHFDEIQDGVDAVATGGTVNVAAGTYNEDVTIAKGLTLTAASGATLDGGIWIKDIQTFTNQITVENFVIQNGTSIDATHDYGIKISGDVGLADQAIVDMHIVNNYFINCGKTDNVLTEMWWNAAVFYDANHFGALGSRYDTIFSGIGEISHNTIVNNLGDPNQRTQLGIGVRSGRNMQIMHNSISGNVAEGIHLWSSVNTASPANCQVERNLIYLSGWVGDHIVNNPRGIWSYASQSSISYNTVISKWYGIVLRYWDDTYWGGVSAGPNYALTVSHNRIHPPVGESMYRGLRISGSNSEISYNEIYGASATGLVFEGFGYPEWGESTECSNNTFTGNCIHDNYDGIYTWDPPYANPTNVNNVFHYNNIVDNTNYGFYNGGTGGVVDAENNWWGDCSGPGPVGPGSGDSVSANVDYDPWLGQQLCDLKDAIAELSDEDFTKPKAAELLAKIDAVCDQYGDGSYRGALNKLERDIKRAIERWIVPGDERDALIDMVNAEITILEGAFE